MFSYHLSIRKVDSESGRQLQSVLDKWKIRERAAKLETSRNRQLISGIKIFDRSNDKAVEHFSSKVLGPVSQSNFFELSITAEQLFAELSRCYLSQVHLARFYTAKYTSC